MRIEYIATRKLASGHNVDTQYEISVIAEQLDPVVEADVQRQISLDRTGIESELRGFDRLYNVTTDVIPIGQETAEFEEFLESVINGETFTFDPDSDDATVVNPVSAMLESTSYRPRRAIPGHYSYSFQVRLL